MKKSKTIHCGGGFAEFAREEGIVGEVRHIREKHASKFNFDLKAIVENAKRRQWKSGRKVVSFAKSKPGSK